MRAEEAKRLASKMHAEKIATQYAEMLTNIQRRAAEGHMQFIFHGYMFPENEQALRLLGYKVGNDRGTDSIMVSWREVDASSEESGIIIPSSNS